MRLDSKHRKVCFLALSGRCTVTSLTTASSHKRTLASPKSVENWSLTTLREKLIKIGAKVVRHGRYVTFQLAEVVVAERHIPENPAADR